VNLKTSRLQEMIDWYGLVVGMRPRTRRLGAWLSNDAQPPYGAVLRAAHRGMTPQADPRGHPSHRVRIRDLDDLPRTYVRLKDAGILPHWRPRSRMTLSFYYQTRTATAGAAGRPLRDWTRIDGVMQVSAAPRTRSALRRSRAAHRRLARRSGTEELHRRAYDGEFAPPEPQDLRVPFA